jgi:hypothetical protein
MPPDAALHQAHLRQNSPVARGAFFLSFILLVREFAAVREILPFPSSTVTISSREGGVSF